jgi:putative membrane protein
MWYMHEGFSGWAIFGGVLMVLFWGAVVALVVWAISRFSRHHEPISYKSPYDIAKERYARGEITKAQFEQIKKDLQ